MLGSWIRSSPSKTDPTATSLKNGVRYRRKKWAANSAPLKNVNRIYITLVPLWNYTSVPFPFEQLEVVQNLFVPPERRERKRKRANFFVPIDLQTTDDRRFSSTFVSRSTSLTSPVLHRFNREKREKRELNPVDPGDIRLSCFKIREERSRKRKGRLHQGFLCL